MHILIPVLHRPDKPTGVCRHAANLARCLANLPAVQRVTLVTGNWQKSYFEVGFNLTSPKIELMGIEMNNTSISRNLWFLFGLPKLVRQINPDLVHLSFPLPFVRQWFNSPVVATVHDLYPYECPENFGFPQVWFNRLFLSQCIHNTTGITCVSEITLKVLKSYFEKVISKKKVSVVYNYVDLSSIKPKPPHTPLLDDNSNFLLTVAQHRKNKNLDILIKAYNLLLQQNKLKPESRLVIVGSSGPETEKILNLIQTHSLQKKVILLDSIKDAELCWLYKECQLFVIPSSTEGFCLPLVEALSLNAKVLCSDIPIFREVCSASNCEYFRLDFDLDHNLVQNLAEKIVEKVSDRDINLSSAPDLRFTQDSVARQYWDFYQSLL